MSEVQVIGYTGKRGFSTDVKPFWRVELMCVDNSTHELHNCMSQQSANTLAHTWSTRLGWDVKQYEEKVTSTTELVPV